MTFAQFVVNFFKIHYHLGVFEKKIVFTSHRSTVLNIYSSN